MSSADILASCVTSLRHSMLLAESAIKRLDSGVQDYTRLATVLQTTRHFELIPETQLKEAQSALVSEIQPEIENLLDRVDKHLDKLERREKSLIAKCELQQGRLSSAVTQPTSGRRVPLGGTSQLGSRMDEVKMQQMRQKKDRLSFAVGRLELQAGQRERQLRKSMAPA